MVLTPRLRTWRERRTLTLRELAATSGVAFSTIHRLETGKPGELRTIRKLAAALGVDPAELMAGEDAPRVVQVVTTPSDQTPRTVSVRHGDAGDEG